MSIGFLDSLDYKLHEDMADNEEVEFYWDKLFEDIKLFAAPQHDGGDIEDHFYGVAAGLCNAEKMQGFRRGLTFALRLFAECSTAPDLTRSQARDEYKKFYKEQAEKAEQMKGGGR